MSAGGFKRPEGLSVLEAARMAVGDVGLDPAALTVGVLPDSLAYSVTAIDRRTAWRASQIARPELVLCWACRESAGLLRSPGAVRAVRATCLAEYPFTEDCGASR